MLTHDELAAIRARAERLRSGDIWNDWSAVLLQASEDEPALVAEVERLNERIEEARNALGQIARNTASPGPDPSWQLGLAHSLIMAVAQDLDASPTTPA